VPTRSVTTSVIVLVLATLVSCSSPAAILRARTEVTPPLSSRLIDESDLPRGWLLAQSIPDHPIDPDPDGGTDLDAGTSGTTCDGDHSEELDSTRERTIASRAFVNDGSILNATIVSDVDADLFRKLVDAIARCDGVVGSTSIDGYPAEILSTRLDLSAPRDTLAVTVLIVTEYEAFFSIWIYARASGDALLTISISNADLSSDELTALVERAVRKARGARG
jgi:hypothetical protein